MPKTHQVDLAPAKKTGGNSLLDELNLEYAGTDDLTRLAARMIDQGEFSSAEDLLMQALTLDPEHLLCQAYLVICVASLGRNDASTNDMARKLASEHPDDPSGWFALGHLDLMSGRRGAAFAHFAHARDLARRDRRMQAAIDRRDPRMPLVFSSLPRDHALNNFFGQIRALFRRK